MNRALGNRAVSKSFCAAFCVLCLALVVTGCKSGSYTPPPDLMAPSVPTSLTATVASATQINLSWTASTDNVAVSGYKVERCQGAGCTTFAQVGIPSTTTFNDTGLTPSTSYSYRVRATDAANNASAFSSTFTASTTAAADTQAPTAPMNLTATPASSTHINLSWTASTDNVLVTGYKVERCSGPGCSTFAQVGTPSGTTFSDTGLTASTSYSYRVRATDAAANLSGFSSTATASTPATTDIQAPTAPTNLTATAASSVQINLSWTASTDNVGVTGYKVEHCQGAGCSAFTQVGTPSGTTFNDTGLTASTSYSYRVRATDAANNLSNFSTIATATTTAGGAISVSISPRRGGITTSQTLPFTATVTNDVGGVGVLWTRTGGTFANSTVSSVTFSSTTAGSFTITATSNADNTKSASATIGVTDLTGVTTYHNNLSRDGSNAKEYALTTSNVKTATFGKLFSCTVDGEVYAQPLWVPNLAVGVGNHNVVFVATENNSVYAFDADISPCHQYWQKNFLSTGVTVVDPADTGETGDINKKIGITGTPVIDAASKTLYVIVKTKEGTLNYHQRLHALSLIDGSEKFGGPADITSAITVPGSGDTGDSSVGCTATAGHVPFCPLREGQRAGLALVNGIVYVAWASHGDRQPYHGWIMGFDASTLARVSTFNDSPDGRESGIWMAGGAPAIDSSNNIYVITGNGDFNADALTPPNTDYGDSFLKLNSSLVVLDSFTAKDEGNLDASDLDLGSGGAAVLVDLPPASPFQHLLVGGGKGSGFNGEIYVINRDNLGKWDPATDHVVQEFPLGSGIFSTVAFWQNTLYAAGVGQHLKAFALNTSNSQFNTTPTSQSTASFGFPGATPSVSSAGTTTGTGIVWAMDTSANGTPNGTGTNGPALLHAYDAANLATELWNSSQGSGNAAASAVKFCVPTVANGKAYIGTQTELDVYGLLP